MTETLCVSLRLQDGGTWFSLQHCHLKRHTHARKQNKKKITGINHCHSVEAKHWHLMMCHNACALLQHRIMLLDAKI